MMQIHEIRATYGDQILMDVASQILMERLIGTDLMSNPGAAKEFLRTKFGNEDREHFGVMFLDSQLRLLAFEVMFSGSIKEGRVYPREVLKRALELNAEAIMVAHNHPSGQTEPSPQDIQLTKQLKSVMELVDIRLLDHFIATSRTVVSLAERGMV